MDSLVEKVILVHVNDDRFTNLWSVDRVYIIWIPNTWINYQNLIPQKKPVNE